MSEGKEKKDDLGKRVRKLEKLVAAICEVKYVKQGLLKQVERIQNVIDEGDKNAGTSN